MWLTTELLCVWHKNAYFYFLPLITLVLYDCQKEQSYQTVNVSSNRHLFKNCIISKNIYGVNSNYVLKFQFSSILTCFNPKGYSPLATSKPLSILLNQSSDESTTIYEGHLESKERFAIKKYLLIIGKKKNMQVLSHTFTYFST